MRSALWLGVLWGGLFVSVCGTLTRGAEQEPARAESGPRSQIQASHEAGAAAIEILPEITPITPPEGLPEITLKARLSTPEQIFVILEIEDKQVLCEKRVGQQGAQRKVLLPDSVLMVRVENWTDDGITVSTRHLKKGVLTPQEFTFEIN